MTHYTDKDRGVGGGDNEPTTLADKIEENRRERVEAVFSTQDNIPSEASQLPVSGSIDWPEDSIERSVKQTAWQAWRAAWNQRGSTESMSGLEERTARTAFNQWWNHNNE